MGGLLLQKIWGLPEKRIPREEFIAISREVLSLSRKLYPELRIGIVPYFKDKFLIKLFYQS